MLPHFGRLCRSPRTRARATLSLRLAHLISHSRDAPAAPRDFHIANFVGGFLGTFRFHAAHSFARRPLVCEGIIVLARSITLQDRAPEQKTPTIRPACRKAIHGLSVVTLLAFRAVYHELRRDLLSRAREIFACRSCGHQANPFWRLCEHCGAGHPVQVRVSPSLVVTIVTCEVSIVLLQLM